MSTTTTKFHKDGSVTLWNVYTQTWERHDASALVAACEEPFGNLILPTLPTRERERIVRIAESIR